MVIRFMLHLTRYSYDICAVQESLCRSILGVSVRVVSISSCHNLLKKFKRLILGHELIKYLVFQAGPCLNDGIYHKWRMASS